ncbi:MAG: GNAT family N-acetyltransferase [Phycisphaeraceae bacterium]|nr:GNAT family N-acetyltransferase [Phycisphaeraceae bacterium]
MKSALQLVPATPDHAPDLARICFEAFGSLHDRHSTPRDFETLETATHLVGMIVRNSTFAGFVATLDGKAVGSNFIAFTDPVAGVGPITVDPSCQGRGVGRALMQAVLDEAAKRRVPRVRLLQEAINTTSLSLYTALGFDWQDSVAIMQAAPGAADSNGIRAMTESDLPAVHARSEAQYGHTRRNEVASALAAGFPAFVRERNGRTAGYLIPGFLGHGFADSVPDMADLIGHASANAPAPFQRILVPLSQRELFRELLSRGCRTLKVMSYMTVGPFETPRSVWLPSILN